MHYDAILAVLVGETIMSARKNTCGNCKWWQYDRRHMTDNEGFCHRYPPTAVWSDHPDYLGWLSSIPKVDKDDWCGEWGLKK